MCTRPLTTRLRVGNPGYKAHRREALGSQVRERRPGRRVDGPRPRQQEALRNDLEGWQRHTCVDSRRKVGRCRAVDGRGRRAVSAVGATRSSVRAGELHCQHFGRPEAGIPERSRVGVDTTRVLPHASCRHDSGRVDRIARTVDKSTTRSRRVAVGCKLDLRNRCSRAVAREIQAIWGHWRWAAVLASPTRG